MPVKQLKISRPPEYRELVAELVEEWRNPESTRQEPVIIEERDRQKLLIHVYVVWSRWDDVDRAQRSEIVMDAAEQCVSQEELLNIVVAMGLTQREAKQMGIEY